MRPAFSYPSGHQNFVPSLSPIVLGRPGTTFTCVQMLQTTNRDSSLRSSNRFVTNSSMLYLPIVAGEGVDQRARLDLAQYVVLGRVEIRNRAEP